MYYVNHKDFENLSIQWDETIGEIEKAVSCLERNDFAQPIKPYLRFGDSKNRIIAMPAYVGGEIESAGIKWIASFPDNLHRSVPRASSVTVLNDTKTGVVQAIFNTPMVSIIRTASVSGYLLKKYIAFAPKKKYRIGVIGGGPIGQHHVKMVQSLLDGKIASILLYDNRMVQLDDPTVCSCDSWQEVYRDSDILITCTSSLDRYIDLPSSEDKLILDVSLRDFSSLALESFSKPFIVDNWEEVNRENTDIEYYYKQGKICKKDSISLCDIYRKGLDAFFAQHSCIFFAPMGMGVFDIAIATYYYRKAIIKKIGIALE